MRRVTCLSLLCFLALGLAACGGSGASDNTLLTGTQIVPTANSTPPAPVPTPAVVLQDGTGTGMSARELAFASEVFDILNQFRMANGQGALLWDPRTTTVAQGHTTYQQNVGVLTHAGPGNCVHPATCLAQRLRAGAVTFVSGGENVALGQRTSQQVMDAWIGSAPHRQNLLLAQWTHVGVGFREGVSGSNPAMIGPWWTLVFVQK